METHFEHSIKTVTKKHQMFVYEISFPNEQQCKENNKLPELLL